MTKPQPGQETAQAVLDQIRMHPETHDQNEFESSCGTTRCVAGWAISLHGMTVNEYAGQRDIIAERLLRLDAEDSNRLFYYTNDAQAVHALEFLAKGDKIDWTAVLGD